MRFPCLGKTTHVAPRRAPGVVGGQAARSVVRFERLEVMSQFLVELAIQTPRPDDVQPPGGDHGSSGAGARNRSITETVRAHLPASSSICLLPRAVNP